jgi:hypothetical protein
MRFELPNLNSLPSFPSARLTDAGHTAVGFAAMAAKKANDNRLDVNARFEPQVRDLRKSAINAVKAVKAARVKVNETVDPMIDRLVERLPETISETVADTVAEVRKVTRGAAGTAEGRLIDVIEFATAIPAKAVRRTTPTATKKGPASKPAPKKTAEKKAAVAKPATKKTAVKNTKKVVARASKRAA